MVRDCVRLHFRRPFFGEKFFRRDPGVYYRQCSPAKKFQKQCTRCGRNFQVGKYITEWYNLYGRPTKMWNRIARHNSIDRSCSNRSNPRKAYLTVIQPTASPLSEGKENFRRFPRRNLSSSKFMTRLAARRRSSGWNAFRYDTGTGTQRIPPKKNGYSSSHVKCATLNSQPTTSC